MKERPPDKILIVDDDVDTRLALDRSLTRLGYEVVIATNGEEALKLAVESPFHVILTDIRMPYMDGHTFLRRAPHDIDTAIVVMSAHGNMDDVVDVLRNGAVDYLKKPWTPSELISAIGRAVEIHEKRRFARSQARDGSAGGAMAEMAESSAHAGTTAESIRLVEVRATPDSVFESIVDRLRRGEITLPTISTLVAEVRSLLRKPNTSFDEYAALIERDQRMAAQILRLSNSAHYARTGRVNDVRAALSRVGLRPVQSMVETIFVHGLSEQILDPKLRALQSKIWKYSVTKAVAMRAIAEVTHERMNPEIAYMSGLLGDAGASFLLWVASERGKTDPDFCLSHLQSQHQELGRTLLDSWGFDPSVALVAGEHHAETPPDPPDPYWNIAVLASEIADQVMPDGDPTRLRSHGPGLVHRCAADLRIGTTSLKKIVEKLTREVDGILETLS